MEVWPPCRHTARVRRCPPRCSAAGRPPGSPAPRAPAWAWRRPAAGVGGPPGRGRRGAAGRAVVRRAGRMVGISKTEVGDSLDLLLGPLADLGFCQPDGTFITSLDNLGQWLAEMAT